MYHCSEMFVNKKTVCLQKPLTNRREILTRTKKKERKKKKWYFGCLFMDNGENKQNFIFRAWVWAYHLGPVWVLITAEACGPTLDRQPKWKMLCYVYRLYQSKIELYKWFLYPSYGVGCHPCNESEPSLMCKWLFQILIFATGGLPCNI